MVDALVDNEEQSVVRNPEPWKQLLCFIHEQTSVHGITSDPLYKQE